MTRLKKNNHEDLVSVSKRATGDDVAALSKTSKSTVSRVFNGGFVSDKARNKVLAVAAELNYRPNPIARSLNTKRSYLIGVAITYLDNQFYPEFIQKLSDQLADLNYRIVLFITHGEKRLDPVLEEIMSYSLDGIVFASSSQASSVAAKCKAAQIPTIMFNNIGHAEKVKCVSAADVEGATVCAQYLIAAGHERFGIVSGLDESSASIQRSEAFKRTVREAGLSEPIIESGLYTFDGALEATTKLLTSNQGIDALFCINDHMALAAIQAVGLLGLKVGEDVSIIGFDNVNAANWPIFNLTTYAHPLDELVKRITLYLMSSISGLNPSEESEFIAGELLIRDSVRKAEGTELNQRGELVWSKKGS